MVSRSGGHRAALDGESHFHRNLVRFAALLRRLGLGVTTSQILTLTDALWHIDPFERADFKNTACIALISRVEDIPLFNRAFDAFWRLSASPLKSTPPEVPRPSAESPLVSSAHNTTGLGDLSENLSTRRSLYSPEEALFDRDFAELTEEERQALLRLLERSLWFPPDLPSRRFRPTGHRGRIDLRRTLRKSLQYGSEAFWLRRRSRKLKQRQLVFFCDVSGSMEPYSRMLLQFMRAASVRLRNCEIFAFSTQLSHLTRRLRSGSVEEALRNTARALPDWGGGTRTGRALRTFNASWGRAVSSGAVAILISDGWDCGDIELLKREMQHLCLRVSRIVWLNPLLGSTDYEPLTRGMQAALPFVDDFLPIHNFRSLLQLKRLLENL
ncbi:MAG: VWA domain-containing protein [Acidobacteria bacterium]|nr:VWA domain-containing protein [Acidobacteriota bacterium]